MRCQKGEKEREDGEAMTQEIEWGRESAMDRSGDTDWGGGGWNCSAGFESNSSVGTQVEYFSNIMAREPLSAPVISHVCVAEPSLF